MFYEVFIPSNGPDGFDVTITVEADNWMTALKSGLERTGETGDAIRNVMCDIKSDNTIHVTDATTARVFVLREVEEEGTVNGTPAPPEEEDASDFATTKMAAVTGPPPSASGPPPAAVPPAASLSDMKTEALAPVAATQPDLSEASTQRMQAVTAPEPEQPSVVIGTPDPAPPEPEQPSVVIGTPDPVPAAQPEPARPEPEQPSVVIGTPDPAPTPQPEQPEPASTLFTTSGPYAQPDPLPESLPAPAAAPVEQQAPVAHTQPASVIVVNDPPSIEIPAYEGDGLSERGWTSEDGRMSIGSARVDSLQSESEAKVVRETRHPSGSRQALDIGRNNEAVSQSALEEVFLEISQIHENNMSMEEVINYVMDLAMSKIQAEAGSIMFADVTGQELYFATARGPKAQDVMEFRVPMNKGLAGFCAREGVSLAISDAERDPRFFAEISEKLGYPTKNVCCAPVQFEGRVYGVLELMNKSQPFTNTEVNVLTYVGRQLAKFVNDLIMAREKI